MVDRKEVELLIRAREIGVKSFDNVAKAVDHLTKRMNEQVVAADRGEVSIKELQAAMKSLDEQGQRLIQQAGMADLYQELARQLDAAQEKALGAAAAYTKLKNEQAAAGEVTKRQERELGRLERAQKAAEREVARLTGSLATQAEKLQEVGIPVSNIAEAQERIRETAQKAGTAMVTLGTIIDGYDDKLKALKSTQDAVAADDLFVQQVLNAEQLQGAANHVDAWTQALVRQGVAEREARDLVSVQTLAAENREVQKRAEYERFWAQAIEERAAAERAAKEVESFRQIGERAKAAAEIRDTGNAAKAAAAPVERFGDAILEIIDPSAKARQSLEGLEKEIDRLSTEVGTAEKPIREYQDAINDLGRVQSALIKQAGLIDTYSDQAAAVEKAARAHREARTRLLELAEAARTADAPNDALAASLRDQEAALASAARELENERQKLLQLSSAMDQAGIDTSDLAAAQSRLRDASAKTAQVVGTLDNAMAGKNTKAGRFLGLRPYELTNLGYQLNDVFTQIASGTSVMQTFAQQGPQILQIFPRMLGALANPLVLAAIAALVAVFGTLFAAIKRVMTLEQDTRDYAKVLKSLGDAGTYTAEGLAKTNQQLRDMGIKGKEAREVMMGFMREGIDPSRMLELARAAKEAAKMTGEDIPNAAKKAADAFTGSYESVAKLDNELGFLTVAERAHIKEMFESGRTAEARTAAFDAYVRKMNAGAEQARGPWAQAWRNFTDVIKAGIHALSTSKWLENELEKLEKWGKALEYVTSLIPGAKGRRMDINGYSKQEIDAVVRTVIGEAGNQGVVGQQAVAAVIQNRRNQSGMTATEVVLAPKQFEAWTKFGDRLRSIDENSAQYAKVLENITPILQGKIADPTGGATHYLNRTVQQGRGFEPAWVSQLAPKGVIGAHSFYQGAFPGMKPGVSQATGTGQSQAQDIIDDLRESQAAAMNLNDELSRVKKAAEDARKRVQDVNGSAEQEALAVQIAETTELYKIERERYQLAQQMNSELEQLLGQYSNDQDDLASKFASINKEFDNLRSKINEARAKGLTEVNGQPLAELEKQVEFFREQRMHQAVMQTDEQKLANLEKQRADVLTEVNNRIADGTLTATDGVARIQEAHAKLLPEIEKVSAHMVEYATALNEAKPSPQLEAFIAKARSAPLDAAAADSRASLKLYEDAVNDLLGARNDRLQVIMAELRDGMRDGAEASRAADVVLADMQPKIADMAAKALAFARALAGTNPSPALQSFIQEMERLQTDATRASPRTGVGADIKLAAIAEEERKLNQMIAERNELVAINEALVARGAMTQAAARAANQNAYNESNAQITTQSAKILALVTTLRDAGTISAETFDLWAAKLHLVGIEAEWTDERLRNIQTTLQNSFADGVVQVVNDFAVALGGALEGANSLGDAFSAAWDSFRSFAADFLRQIANMILQQAILNALQAAAGGNGAFSGLARMIVGTKHEGGLARDPSPSRRVSVPDLSLIPSYHTGTLGVGLKKDEQMAIVKKNEEILKEDNPRHVKNWLSNPDAPSQQPLALRIINTLDPVEVLRKALGTAAGQDVLVNHMARNSSEYSTIFQGAS